MKKEGLQKLPSYFKLQKMEIDFDLKTERECFSCFYDLHLSAAGCKCSPDRFACLKHANIFCSCEIDHRFVILRYSTDELNTLVEALEGGLDALKELASKNFKWADCSDTDGGLVKMDMESEVFPMDCCEQKESSSSSPRVENIVEGNGPCCSRSHVSSEVVQSEPQRGTSGLSASHVSVNSHNEGNDETQVMNKKAKVKHEVCIDLNMDVIPDGNESKLLLSDSHGKEAIENLKAHLSACYQEKVLCSGTVKEQDTMQVRSDCNSSNSHKDLNKDQPSCSRVIEGTCSFDVKKLFGVDLSLPHQQSKLPLVDLLKTDTINGSNVRTSVTDQRFQKKLETCVEPINFGCVMCGKLWCSKQAIFPKGMLQWVFPFNLFIILLASCHCSRSLVNDIICNFCSSCRI